MQRSVKIRLLLGGIALCLFAWLMLGMRTQERSAIRLESEPVLAKEDAGKKVMYLTFDDGPSQNTEQVLDILDEHDAKATFFVTNEFPDYVSLLKEEVRRGHVIGVHTYSHDYAEIYQSTDAYFADIEQMQAVIREQTGRATKILRFPGGTSNTVSARYCDGIMHTLSEEVTRQGYAYYVWNATNGDGDTGLSADALVAQAKREIGSQEVVMLLMHDGAGNEASVEALPEILRYCQEQGYEFRVIDETTPQFHHHINN